MEDAMRHLYAIVIFLLVMSLAGVSLAQESSETTPEPTPDTAIEYPRVPVQVGSANIRAKPSFDSVEIGSVFLDDPLEVVGRNADGLWFEVRRPGRRNNLGWIFNEMVDWEFQPELLPLTDSETGVVGTPIEDTGFTVFVLQNAVMRDKPDRTGVRITTVPLLTTVPVIERNQDASWLKVNYLGQVGWIVGFVTRRPDNIMTAPLGQGLPPMPPRFIIPPEIQLEQVERLRAYIIDSRDVATSLGYFWDTVAKGDTMPCQPPAFVTDYLVSDHDVQQLPELNRIVPRMTEAIDHINSSIDPLYTCGVLELRVVLTARADAINAGIILDNSLVQLANVESIIRNQIDK